MIEVEKKFILSDHDRDALLLGATSLGTKIFTDVYYDTANYLLTKKNWWLRSRDGRFELKIPRGKMFGSETNNFEELEDDIAIGKNLGLPEGKSLRGILDLLGYRPFVTIRTIREKFEKGGFSIDIDSTDYGFRNAEIELMVSREEDMNGAMAKIVAFARAHGLAVVPLKGKVLEYLSRYDRKHFAALEEAWGMKL